SFIRVSVRLYFSNRHHESSYKNDQPLKRLILIGAGQTGEKIAREIINSASSAYSIVGFMDDNPIKHGAMLHGYKILGTVADLDHITLSYDELLITAPSATGDQMRRIVKHCKNAGKRYKTVPSLTELIDGSVSLSTIRDVSYNDLLGRAEVKLDMNSIDKFLKGKRVLVTGAGGSIGSELVRQCLNFDPAMLLLLDNSEYNLFMVEQELNKVHSRTSIRFVLGNIRDKNWLGRFCNDYKPQVVLHAAAYKHVPIQERHPREAVLTNVFGTLNLIDVAHEFKIEKFVLVSTDKAVHPVNVMGATKRLAEMMIQSVSRLSNTAFMAVRFGNVLGSSGSVIPIFQDQIKHGGPVRITHPDMIRYFMSIPESAQLILQAGALGEGGEVFVLDMGKPVNIKEMAYDLIRLSGFEPEEDIPVVYTGVRPGEKLFEELIISGEHSSKTEHSKIMILRNGNRRNDWSDLKKEIDKLVVVAKSFDSDTIKSQLMDTVPEYEPREFIQKPSNLDLNIDTASYRA
ncbi:MAG: polysaccharide biosynthesis protein, partial [Candidatus Marinimicrobia bacterium]|nr:polysaccharide biosynthesis protein [Candidatus Neomarinimicrobiota bacterium]